MASTTFINNQTVIVAAWLNDVNAYTYNGTSLSGILNGTTLALQTGGVNAINIDASQNVTFANPITFSNGNTSAQSAANGTMTLNNLSITSNYTLPANNGANSVGPITIASGQSVTISSGSRWVIL